ncbi:hypothetical protein LINPERHAP2_LOCUS36559 [Linum perenne]
MSSPRYVLYQLCASKEWQSPDYITVESGPNHFPSFNSTLPIFSAQLQLSGSTILLSDNSDDSAQLFTLKSFTVLFSLCLQSEDVYATVAKAITAGATPVGEIAKVEGVWCGKVKGPYDFVWLICSTSAYETVTEVEGL